MPAKDFSGLSIGDILDRFVSIRFRADQSDLLSAFKQTFGR